MMSLCRTLYETAPNEKETMGQIFDREFRREKNLDNAQKKAGEKKVAAAPENKAQ